MPRRRSRRHGRSGPRRARPIEIDDEVGSPGSGPVAVGALPFDPGRTRRAGRCPSSCRRPGRRRTRWVTDRVGPDATTAEPADASSAAAAGARSRRRSRVEQPNDPVDAWCADLVAARQRLPTAVADKVVLAREVRGRGRCSRSSRTRPSPSVSAPPTRRACSSPSTASWAPAPSCSWPAPATWCAPIRWPAPRRGATTRSTDARLAAALLASTKDQREHRCTIDMVHDTLLPWCSYLDEEAEPSIVAMANVQHLATSVEGRLSRPAGLGARADARAAPDAGGRRLAPRRRPSDLIAELRGLDRGRYAGPVGWVDAAGNGEWAVGIRCAEHRRRHGPRVRRRRRRRRLRPRRRAGRDPGQAAGHARRHRAALSSPALPPGRSDARPRRRVDARRARPRWRLGRCGRQRPRARRPARCGGYRRATVDLSRRSIATAGTVGGGQRRQVDAVRRAEELLEPRRRQRRGLGQEREDAAAVVVDDDDGEVDARVGPRRAGRWCRAGRRRRRRAAAVGRRRCRGATPTAVDTTPSMPLAPRLASTRTPAAGRRTTRRRGSASTTTRQALPSSGRLATMARATAGSVARLRGFRAPGRSPPPRGCGHRPAGPAVGAGAVGWEERSTSDGSDSRAA